MANPEVVPGHVVPCQGAYPKDHPLESPVTATVVFFADGNRQVGCSYLSRVNSGFCEVADVAAQEQLSCVHLFPQQSILSSQATNIEARSKMHHGRRAVIEIDGTVVRDLRVNFNLSQKQLRESTGISIGRLSRIESMPSVRIKTTTATSLANALQTDVSNLKHKKPDMPNDNSSVQKVQLPGKRAYYEEIPRRVKK